MPLDYPAVSVIASVCAVVVSGLSFRRTNRKDDGAALEKTIDDRIQVKLGADIAVIKSEVQGITRTLAGNGDLVRNTIDATQNAITEAAREMLRIRGGGD